MARQDFHLLDLPDEVLILLARQLLAGGQVQAAWYPAFDRVRGGGSCGGCASFAVGGGAKGGRGGVL